MILEPGLSPVAISGLILAGGASSRFGEPKALALLHGRPLVSWVASALAPFCEEVLVSIGIRSEEAGFRDAVPAARLVRDRRGDQGPIEGLRRGCEAARGVLLALAPCDAPLLQPGLYRALLRTMADHEAAVPRLRIFDPVRAVYRRSAVLRVLDREPKAIRSPSSLVDRLDVAFLEGWPLFRADMRLASFIDVNRRQDLDRVLPMAVDALRATPAGPRFATSPGLG